MGSDVNLPGPKGVTPLMQAALFRDIAGARSILARGGMWNLDSQYLTPCLNLTIQQDLAELLELALAQGLPRDFALFRRYPLPWLANYYDSPRCKELFPDNAHAPPTPVDDPRISLQRNQSTKEAIGSHTFRDATPFSFICLLKSDGKPRLVHIDPEDTDRFQEVELKREILDIAFAGDTLSELQEDEAIIAHITLQIANNHPRKNLSIEVSQARQIELRIRPHRQP